MPGIAAVWNGSFAPSLPAGMNGALPALMTGSSPCQPEARACARARRSSVYLRP